MTEVSGNTSLGMLNTLESRFVLPRVRVLKVLMPKCCYAVLMLSHDPSQNLGVDRDKVMQVCACGAHLLKKV